MKPIFIAEVKTKSPFGYKSDKTFKELLTIAARYGDWVSIHTSKEFGGGFEELIEARDYTYRPILAKGFHHDPYTITDCLNIGAQFVLTVDYIPPRELADCCLMEFSSYDKLMRALNVYPNGKYVYNNRNLKTGSLKDKNEYDDYRKVTQWLCQASFIYGKKDIEKEVDSFIVGTFLEQFVEK